MKTLLLYTWGALLTMALFFQGCVGQPASDQPETAGYSADSAVDPAGGKQALLTEAVTESATETGPSIPAPNTDFALTDAWVSSAINLQDQVDSDLPLSQSLFIGTHNSYNAEGDGYNVDPNQTLSMKNQMRQGVRELVFDVHWVDIIVKNGMVLCHGQSNDIGCDITRDRSLRDGLNDIKTYLGENPKAVILLKMELFVSGKWSKLANQIDGVLGSYLYKPGAQGSGCQYLNTRVLTKNMVRAAGKNVILVGEGCKSDSNYTSRFFAGVKIGTATNSDKFVKLKSTDCSNLDPGVSSVSGRTTLNDIYGNDMVRMFDGQTKKGIAGDPGNPVMTAATIQPLLSCGLNVFEMFNYKGDQSDVKEKFIWSWDAGYPTDSANLCLRLNAATGKFRNSGCAENYSFACYKPGSYPGTGTWKVTAGYGSFDQGSATCAAEFGSSYTFRTPGTAKQLDALNAQTLGRQVWLNGQSTNGSQFLTWGNWQYSIAP